MLTENTLTKVVGPRGNNMWSVYSHYQSVNEYEAQESN